MPLSSPAGLRAALVSVTLPTAGVLETVCVCVHVCTFICECLYCMCLCVNALQPVQSLTDP